MSFKKHVRRFYGILGQDALSQFGLIGCSDIEVYVDKSKHELSGWSWETMGQFETEIWWHNFTSSSKVMTFLDTIGNSVEVAGEHVSLLRIKPVIG